MKTKTRQELFDAAWIGLRSQGFQRSMYTDSECAYRGKEGRRCAIGWSIDDKDYLAFFEESTVVSTADQMGSKIRKAAGISNYDIEFARRLQRCHDDCITDPPEAEPKILEERLREFAENEGLTIP